MLTECKLRPAFFRGEMQGEVALTEDGEVVQVGA
jgi:hypothetical protein